jgi:ribonuclease J
VLFRSEGIKVLYSYYHAQKIADLDKAFLYRYKKAKIEFKEICDNPNDKVLLSKDSHYYRNVILKLGDYIQSSAIFSMWHGYLERSDIKQFLNSNNIHLLEIHTSGHAYISQLQALANALNPRWIIPIHTFYPEKFEELFPNVMKLVDGQKINLY